MSGFSGLDVDPAFLRRAQLKERKSCEVIYQTFAPAVYTLALRMCGSPAQAQDLVQDTFIEVLRSLPKFRGDSSLATWVRAITVSKCLMHLRSAWQRKATGFADGEEAALVGDSISSQRIEQALDLEGALASLSEQARAVVWLHDVEGYTHQEIATMMQRSVSFSKSQLARAHASLREKLMSPQKRGVDQEGERQMASVSDIQTRIKPCAT